MLIVARRGVAGHRARYILTGLAISLAVGLVAASFMFTDSLGRAFENLFGSALAGFDVQVRPEVDPELIFGVGEPMDQRLIEDVLAVAGVEAAQGSLFGFVQVIVDGEAIGAGGAPSFMVSWPDLLPTFEVRSGSKPEAAGEVAIDPATADRTGLGIGDRIEISGGGSPATFIVTGTASIEGFDSFGGAVSAYAPLSTVQEVLGLPGKVSTIEVAVEPGADIDQVIDAISPMLPERVEAVSAQTAADEQLGTLKDALGFLNTFLLVFAGVAVFVAAFLIQNTFRILVAQRTRELAFLRAIGAGRRQVAWMVLAEASLVAVIASLVGIGLGALLALGIRLLLSFGGNLPDAPLQLLPRTVLVCIGTGLAVTLLSALLPAVIAGRVLPLQAIRQVELSPVRRVRRRRAAAGSILIAAGLALLAGGLLADIPDGPVSEIGLVGMGAALLFIGVAVMAGLVARAATRALGAPLRGLGMPARLAVDNAGRSPRRTAATASAIMIGLALVALVMVLADSLETSADRLVADRFRADLVVSPSGLGGDRLSPDLALALAEVPEVATAAPLRMGQVLAGGDTRLMAGTDPALIPQVLEFNLVAGEISDLGPGEVAIRQRLADRIGVAVGDAIDVTFARTGAKPMTVAAIWDAQGVGAGLLVDLATYQENFVEQFDDSVFINLTEGVDPEDGRQAVEAVVAQFPGAEVQDQSQFATSATDQIDGLVRLVLGLLGVAVFISLFAITNTLSLSVLERTREMGMLRAVGMSRRQLRGTVIWEAVLIAAFGAILGIGLGLFFAWAVVQSTDAQALIFSVPIARLGLALVVAVGASVLAAVLPARRAARVDVVKALAYE
jgi:putative ABC transport system permease protein